MLTIAHLSDLHLGSVPEALPRARRALDHVRAMDPLPDVLLVTGDVADHGREEEYADARALLDTWPGPLLVGTGNHDVRGPFARVLLGQVREGPLDQVLDVGGVRLLMLDSLVPAVDEQRVDHGWLSTGSLTWLAEELAASDAPSFVCFHHPPAGVGIPGADRVGLRNADALAPVLAAAPHLVATLVGHNHIACATTFAGRPQLVGGGVVSTVTLDAEDLPPLWLDAPPTLAVHLLDDSGRLTTHWRALPVGPSPG